MDTSRFFAKFGPLFEWFSEYVYALSQAAELIVSILALQRTIEFEREYFQVDITLEGRYGRPNY